MVTEHAADTRERIGRVYCDVLSSLLLFCFIAYAGGTHLFLEAS